MQIRWKAAVLMLAIAGLPLAVTAWLDVRALRGLGQELAAQSAQALTEHARESLDQLADDYARLVRREQQLVEALLREQAREVERLLADLEESAAAVHFVDDFQNDDPDLQLTTDPKYSYLDDSGASVSVLISYENVVFIRPDGELSEAGLQTAARLTELQPFLRDAQRHFADLVYWQYVALESGLTLVYPGSGRLPREFDPRRRTWYAAQRERPDLNWSQPVRDVVTGQTTIGATMPIRDAAGRFVGVTGIDVVVTKVLKALKLPPHLASKSSILLVSVVEQPGTAVPSAAIIARQDAAATGGDWREPIALVALRSDTPEQTGRVITALHTERNGMLRLPYRDQDAFWVFRAFDDANNFLVFIVPVAAAVEPALAAADYALKTTERRIDTTLLIMAAGMVLVIGVALGVSRAITGPVQQLSQAVDSVAAGNFQAKVEIRTGDELERLGHAFNAMLPRLEEHARMRETMAVAQEVQEHLLPRQAPKIPGIDIAGLSNYCDHTGGDYFDFLDLRELRPGVVGVVIGDVSGHGIPSALLMTSARALVHGFAGQAHTAKQIFAHINTHLVQDLKAGRFMTLFYLTLDTHRRVIEWASAGHGPALRYNRDTDTFSALAGKDIPLGIVPNWQFGEAEQSEWRAGDVIVLGTDGIWETRNPQGEPYGRARLNETIRKLSDLDAQSICDRIIEELAAFRGGQAQRDDVTLIVIKAA
jgi:sigma-B regulation protein RsbU (phosphoserine phosphatase)